MFCVSCGINNGGRAREMVLGNKKRKVGCEDIQIMENYMEISKRVA